MIVEKEYVDIALMARKGLLFFFQIILFILRQFYSLATVRNNTNGPHLSFSQLPLIVTSYKAIVTMRILTWIQSRYRTSSSGKSPMVPFITTPTSLWDPP